MKQTGKLMSSAIHNYQPANVPYVQFLAVHWLLPLPACTTQSRSADADNILRANQVVLKSLNTGTTFSFVFLRF